MTQSVREAEQVLDRLGLPHAAWRVEACNEVFSKFTLRLAEEAEQEAREHDRLANELRDFSRAESAANYRWFAAWLREKARE